jgi:hypothetical protein
MPGNVSQSFEAGRATLRVTRTPCSNEKPRSQKRSQRKDPKLPLMSAEYSRKRRKKPAKIVRPAAPDPAGVIGRQATGPHRKPRLRRLLGQQIAIDLLITGLEEDRLAAIAALGHVVGKAWER